MVSRLLLLVVILAFWPGAILRAVTLPQPGAPRTFLFREPLPASYRLEDSAQTNSDWITLTPLRGGSAKVLMGPRIVIRVVSESRLKEILAATSVRISKQFSENLFILEAGSAVAALEAAESFATLPGVEVCHPVRIRSLGLKSSFAQYPSDPLFSSQWHLENRTEDGLLRGADINARAAWSVSRGAGITIAIADDGVEVAHPDLASNAVAGLHFNFVTSVTNGNPASTSQSHGTATAGVAAAVGYNGRGVSGVAPNAHFASWVVFNTFNQIASEDLLANMFQYQSNTVAIQNHSWGNAQATPLEVTEVEKTAITNAVLKGRGGKGVILVRAAGNERGIAGDANFDAYASDPFVIAVGAIRTDGRPTWYSSPGACVLVGAPSAESNIQGTAADLAYQTITTTDRVGDLGRNTLVTGTDSADYGIGASGHNGTSASTPQIAGIAALMLSVNAELSYRDVQQILILSARHIGGRDPTIATNGAGFKVSHNDGFGIPDAGEAVRLAKLWKPRPPVQMVTVRNTNSQTIPDDGLRLHIRGQSVPATIASIPAFSGRGPMIELTSRELPIINIGQATNLITTDLRGSIALIQRGVDKFYEKLEVAAAAGAEFAVIYNNVDVDVRLVMAGTDYSRIPALSIAETPGEQLIEHMGFDGTTTGQIEHQSATYSLVVTNSLLCEHVSLRLVLDHPSLTDLRIVLISPSGTVSAMQRMNLEAPISYPEWTWHSVQNFFEQGAGVWRLYVTDERPDRTGSVSSVTLTLRGVPILDSDHDGLDDNWELANFGSLSQGPADDPNGNGYSNMREYLMGTDPRAASSEFKVVPGPFDASHVRLAWTGPTNSTYEIFSGANPAVTLSLSTNIPAGFPETEFIAPTAGASTGFFRVRRKTVQPNAGLSSGIPSDR